MSSAEIAQRVRSGSNVYLSLYSAMAEALGETEEEGNEESSVRLHRVGEPTTPEPGIRFQRCGGGRRIIRRQRGGN